MATESNLKVAMERGAGDGLWESAIDPPSNTTCLIPAQAANNRQN